MKKEDAVVKAQEKLAALRQREKDLHAELKQMGERIREDAKPTALVKSAVSGMFKDKSSFAETATAALGLGAGVLARGVVRRQQQKLSLAGKATGLAVALVLGLIARRKRSKS